MVFVWGTGPRRRRPRYGRRYPPAYGRGFGGPVFGRGYGPPPGYYRRGGGGGSCLRDLLFLETGCCLAQALGCGSELLLVAPRAVRQLGRERTAGGGLAERMVAAIGLYQREISPHRPPCCRFTPTCSAYGIEAIRTHGARRGGWLTLRRLLRCRPGATGGADPVPAAA
ncbi:membrane protein insertion efficiency factor YidD [Geodermatophilus sp. URMC 64]